MPCGDQYPPRSYGNVWLQEFKETLRSPAMRYADNHRVEMPDWEALGVDLSKVVFVEVGDHIDLDALSSHKPITYPQHVQKIAHWVTMTRQELEDQHLWMSTINYGLDGPETPPRRTHDDP